MSFRTAILAAATVLVCMTATVAATPSIARAQAPAPRFKVLVIAELRDPTNPNGDEIHRPYVEAAKIWLAKLAADSNFTVSYLESPNTITDSMLGTVDVIWQMNYTPFRWNAVAKAALEKYLDGGKGGWLGVHHASLYGSAVTTETWPWYFDNLIGGINYKNYVSQVRVRNRPRGGCRASGVQECSGELSRLHRGVVHLGQKPARARARAGERGREHLRVRRCVAERDQDGRPSRSSGRTTSSRRETCTSSWAIIPICSPTPRIRRC